MAMQYDVKSAYAETNGVMVPYRTRLKGIVMEPYDIVTGHTSFVDNISIAGTYTRSTTTATITATNHNLQPRDLVQLDFDAGGPTDDSYVVQTVVNANTFTITVADSGNTSGTVTVWNDVLFHFDADINVATNILIPGEGILAQNGIRVFLATNISAAIFYG